MRLFLPPPLRARILAEAAAAAPLEVCGLIVGAAECGALLATRLVPSPNRAEAAAFAIDPALHCAVQRDLRAAGAGTAVIGCYHSHPGGDPQPSARDRACGGPAGFVWLIAVPGGADNGRMAAFSAPDFDALEIV